MPAVELLGDGPAAAPPKVRLRHRVLPRTLLGLTAFILSFAIGAGLSGVVLYSYYQYKLNQTDDRVNALIAGYQHTFAQAQADLQAQTANDKSQIAAQLGPLQSLESGPATIAKLTRQLAPSVFFVHTLDASGQASVGTAWVVSSNGSQSLLLTSYTTVAAATRTPGPAVYVQQGQSQTQVTVRSWDPANDLALIVLPRGGLAALQEAPSSPGATVGERLYAVTGQGANGASLAQGAITDVEASGVAHTAPVGPAYQGGPLVDDSGRVVAVASRTYAPLGFASDSTWFAPYPVAACTKVLTCPGGALPAS